MIKRMPKQEWWPNSGPSSVGLYENFRQVRQIDEGSNKVFRQPAGALARSSRTIAPEWMRAALRFIRAMFEKDNTPIWLGGLVAVAAFFLVASYSQIRTVEQPPITGFAAGSQGNMPAVLTREQIQGLSNIAPAAGGR